jgi:hypothetical protein
MEYTIFMLIVLCIIVISLYFRYEPAIDIVLSNNKYIVLLWYNSWETLSEGKRTFKKLFEI